MNACCDERSSARHIVTLSRRLFLSLSDRFFTGGPSLQTWEEPNRGTFRGAWQPRELASRIRGGSSEFVARGLVSLPRALRRSAEVRERCACAHHGRLNFVPSPPHPTWSVMPLAVHVWRLQGCCWCGYFQPLFHRLDKSRFSGYRQALLLSGHRTWQRPTQFQFSPFPERLFPRHIRTQVRSRHVGATSLDRGTTEPRLPLGHCAAGSCHEDHEDIFPRRQLQ